MEIRNIIKIIKNNNETINRYYMGQVGFEVDLSDNELNIFIHTRYKRKYRRNIEKIKRLFKAKDVDFVETTKDAPAFWSITLKEEKKNGIN